MSETADIYRAMKRENQKEADHRRMACFESYNAVMARARSHGIGLRLLSDIQYQFTLPSGALLNYYPGNHRLYWDKNKPRGPFLKCPNIDGWTLGTVLDAIISESK